VPTTYPHPPSLISPELLKVAQVADLLGVSRRTVWNLRDEGTLLPVKIRGCVRWRRADVARYINQLEVANG
jgi:excisionase family DNA binding protein